MCLSEALFSLSQAGWNCWGSGPSSCLRGSDWQILAPFLAISSVSSGDRDACLDGKTGTAPIEFLFLVIMVS